MIHPDDLQTVIDKSVAHIESGAVNYELGLRLRTRAGGYRWFYDLTQLVRNEDGDLVLINSYLLDQTEHKRVEEALHISEEKAKAILNSSFQLFGMLAVDGTLIDLNQTALQLDGLPKSELLGRPFWECPSWSYSPELQDRVRAAIKDAAAGAIVRFEVTHPKPDGQLEVCGFFAEARERQRWQGPLLDS